MKHRLTWYRSLALSVALLCALPALADDSMDQEAAEARLEEVRNEIQALQDQLTSRRSEHSEEQSRLRELDFEVQEINLQSRDLDQQKQLQLEELNRLEAEKQVFLDSLELEQAQLVEQVRAAYRLGRQSRLKLLLNQDSPTQLSRMLAYYDYLNRAQIEQISGLKETLTTLDTMQQSIDQELVRLQELQSDLDRVMDELSLQRANRLTLLENLSGQISSSESQLEELEQDQRDLQTLIERLTDVLADIPDDLGSEVSVSGGKGSLPMPVNGPVRFAFGQRRAGGIRWQGWLIGSEPGVEVQAVAHGRVAFADWLRGYGLMVIIDHGEGYMSLYGHNESLLHDVGDWVEPGEPISVVGISAGKNQGLYFELRHNGKVVDPAVWLKR